MRAALIHAFEGPTSVQIQDVREPMPAPGQVLVDVHYAGVVFPDVLNTRGEYQMRPVLPLPADVSLATGAALPLNYLTMHFALQRRAGLRAGETVWCTAPVADWGCRVPTRACLRRASAGRRVDRREGQGRPGGWC